MSDWKMHDGKGVPADAIPGVTEVQRELHWTSPWWLDGIGNEGVWTGKPEPWDWQNFGKLSPRGRWGRVIAYRNPSAASTDAGMAMLKEILDRETVEPVKRKVTT